MENFEILERAIQDTNCWTTVGVFDSLPHLCVLPARRARANYCYSQNLFWCTVLSLQVHKIESLSTSLEGFDSLADLDSTLMGNLGEDLFLGDDFLECDDSFLTSLSNPTSMITSTPELVLEAPPIGLSLKKSDSLVDLINRHLTQSHFKAVSFGT